MKFLLSILFIVSFNSLTVHQQSVNRQASDKSSSSKDKVIQPSLRDDPGSLPVIKECVAPEYDIGAKVLVECESFIPPGVNISDLITTPSPSAFFQKHRNYHRLSRNRRGIRCFRSADSQIPPDIMNSRLQHCIARTRAFMQPWAENGTCTKKTKSFFASKDRIDPEVYDIMDGCVNPLWDRAKGTWNNCKNIFGRRKRRQVEKLLRFRRYGRMSCFYGFFDIFSSNTFKCIGGAIGMAGHLVDGCLSLI